MCLLFQALIGLDQLHKVIASERRQEYLISRIESTAHKTKSPVRQCHILFFVYLLKFEAVVEWNVLEVITHPVMKKLIDLKWRKLTRSVN